MRRPPFWSRPAAWSVNWSGRCVRPLAARRAPPEAAERCAPGSRTSGPISSAARCPEPRAPRPFRATRAAPRGAQAANKARAPRRVVMAPLIPRGACVRARPRRRSSAPVVCAITPTPRVAAPLPLVPLACPRASKGAHSALKDRPGPGPGTSRLPLARRAKGQPHLPVHPGRLPTLSWLRACMLPRGCRSSRCFCAEILCLAYRASRFESGAACLSPAVWRSICCCCTALRQGVSHQPLPIAGEKLFLPVSRALRTDLRRFFRTVPLYCHLGSCHTLLSPEEAYSTIRLDDTALATAARPVCAESGRAPPSPPQCPNTSVTAASEATKPARRRLGFDGAATPASAAADARREGFTSGIRLWSWGKATSRDEGGRSGRSSSWLAAFGARKDGDQDHGGPGNLCATAPRPGGSDAYSWAEQNQDARDHDGPHSRCAARVQDEADHEVESQDHWVLVPAGCEPLPAGSGSGAGPWRQHGMARYLEGALGLGP